jgi:hypothetical protein
LAMAVGMPAPAHPLQLWVAFTFVTFAFVGLGLVIAMLADNVPAVQALGQCIFLPMLIIGGVAVQLTALPDWALHVSAFFPGRYAVDAIRAAAVGDGLHHARFSLLALLLIGTAGLLAGAKLFRWDAQQRFAAMRGKGWVAVALGAWVSVGLLAEARGHVGLPSQAAASQTAPAKGRLVLRAPNATPAEVAATSTPASGTATTKPAESTPPKTPAVRTPAPGRRATTNEGSALPPPASSPNMPASQPEPSSLPANPNTTLCPSAPSSWDRVTVKNIENDLVFDRSLPPDTGVVTPIASDDQQAEPQTDEKLQRFGAALTGWAPAKVIDPVQRVRNYLYAAAVPDVLQLDMERWIPWYVYDRLMQEVSTGDLTKILYWIACTPDRGADPVAEDMRTLTLPGMPADVEEVRNRAAIYGVKLLGRLLGKI